VPPAQEGIATWVALNNCAESTVETDEYSGISDTTYSSCQDGTAVEVYTIEHYGNGWPDMANETICAFFTQHSMP
jgi:poly(3-hydroxybutyrate) depolymerase